ncbi:hypothetical protein B7P43_G12778, partial [Cryptotermes secundus]
MKEGFKPKTEFIRDKKGLLINNKTEIMNTWKEYFEQLLNQNQNMEDNEDNEEENTDDGEGEEEEIIEPPTKEEVEEALKEQKLNKAPGGDNIPAELLKAGGQEGIIALHRIINKVWEEEKIPEDWGKSIICPIFKKGDKLTCSNYRGISLLPTAYKILTRILKKRLDPYIEKIIGEYQSGFRPNRSTIDNLFTLRQITEKCWEFNIDIYLCFIDFKQAYDTIIRKKLRMIMSTFGIPTKLSRIINLTMTETINQVKIQNQLTECFKTNQGLKQGDSLAPSLFNLVLEYIVRKCNVDTRNTIAYKQTQIMAYADDIIIVSRSLGAMKETYKEIKTIAKTTGLEVNVNKTKMLIQSRRNPRQTGEIN